MIYESGYQFLGMLRQNTEFFVVVESAVEGNHIAELSRRARGSKLDLGGYSMAG